MKISQGALYARVKRYYARDGEVLRTNRSSNWNSDLGRYYTIDLATNRIEHAHIDLEGVAREVGLLKSDEQVEQE